MAQATEPGMLLLDPGGPRSLTPGRPCIYTVVSKRTVIAAYGGVRERSQLHKAEVPEGWTVINNRALARYLTENVDDFRRKPAAEANRG